MQGSNPDPDWMNLEIIKVLSLHQPWASLVMVGAKTIETRSWPPPKGLIGKKLAIHATKKIVQIQEHLYPLYNRGVKNRLGEDWTNTLPTGAIVAIATVQKAIQMTTENFPKGEELLYGEYAIGRWMWYLKDIIPVNPPIPARGHQGIWNFHPKPPSKHQLSFL